MVAMRRKRGGGGRGRRVAGQGETLYSFRTLVLLTLVFLSVIMLLLIVPLVTKYIKNSLDTTTTSSTTLTKAMIDKDSLSSLVGRVFHNPSELPDTLIRQLDAILVLGGGRPKSLTEPPVHVQRRCDDAAVIVQKRQQQQNQQHSFSSSSSTAKTLPILCLSAGTAHLPQLLSADGLPIWESTSCAAYLHKHYIDDNNSKNENKLSSLEVHVETTSYDTIGNAFYARTSHTDLHQRPSNKWRNLLIVTNEFHMERSQAIFDWIFSLPTKSSTSSGAGNNNKTKRKSKRRKNDNGDDDGDGYKLFYLASPNVGLSNEAVAARVEKERASLKSVHKLSQQYNESLLDVYEFLTQQHDLYTASKLVQNAVQREPSSVVSDLVRKSYGGAEK